MFNCCHFTAGNNNGHRKGGGLVFHLLEYTSNFLKNKSELVYVLPYNLNSKTIFVVALSIKRCST